MARKKKSLPILENVMITGVASEGKAIAKVNEVVTFVPFAVPGDVVNLQVTKKKRSFMEARVIDFVEKSAVRSEPFCEHYGICGGCKWQTIPYEKQLEIKDAQVKESLFHLAKYQENINKI